MSRDLSQDTKREYSILRSRQLDWRKSQPLPKPKRSENDLRFTSVHRALHRIERDAKLSVRDVRGLQAALMSVMREYCPDETGVYGMSSSGEGITRKISLKSPGFSPNRQRQQCS